MTHTTDNLSFARRHAYDLLVRYRRRGTITAPERLALTTAVVMATDMSQLIAVLQSLMALAELAVNEQYRNN